ncbi:hypothetical protein D9757_003852 [Collybiopsis confluens]|uniref:Uncharacterized protein n=1 Tax=Collybiopsis confluens TaxID=2823264 RepID=A0A8H5HV25_9AGAR|nr:hypothetical protein D9757_003852 [Collybiopsis confluens]
MPNIAARALLVTLILNGLCLLLIPVAFIWALLVDKTDVRFESLGSALSLGIPFTLVVVILSIGATMLIVIGIPDPSNAVLFTLSIQVYSFELIVWSAVVGVSAGMYWETSPIFAMIVLPWISATLTILSLAILVYPTLDDLTQNWSMRFPAQAMFSTIVVAGTLRFILTVLGYVRVFLGQLVTLLGDLMTLLMDLLGQLMTLLMDLLDTLLGRVTRNRPGGSAEEVPMVTLVETTPPGTLESYEKLFWEQSLGNERTSGDQVEESIN